jgi:hypothetical protein
LRPGQDHTGALRANPASRLEHNADAITGYDDALPGRFLLTLAGSSDHDSS